jgi:hypothetical protein
MVSKGFSSLNWSIPSKPLPHGINGMISVFVGAYVIIASLAGYLGHISNPAILGIYMYSSFANALSGLIMANIAPVAFQNLFRACAVFQMCLVYFVGRFSPLFPDVTELGPALWILDCIFSIAIIAGIAWFATSAMTMVSPAIACGVLVGSFGLLLLSGYPLQLAIFGQEWWDCVQSVYPEQSSAMVAYIYVSSTWAFALILFGATLWNRKIIGDTAFGIGICGLVMATLIGMVLMQEVHYPEPLSTQKLWLPCPEPMKGTWSAWMVDNLDTSALARTILATIRTTS